MYDFPWIPPLLEACPPSLELTNEAHLIQVLELAETLLASCSGEAELDKLRVAFMKDKAAIPLLAHLALKLALSRRFVEGIHEPTHVSVVFAAYKEHNRIRKAAEHPHGEDFLARKIHQLDWLFGVNPNLSWDLRLVDDGDPEKTGEIAQEILSSRVQAENAKVLFLEKAVAQGLPVTRPMHSASESNKGGAILYGMWDAIQEEHPNHVVVFTDADLSTHLGQTGLLLRPILAEGKLAAIGSRREVDSVVVKGGARNHRGKLFIYLWKRLLPILSEMVDTQCGFKAFRAKTVREIVLDSEEKRFAFDIELLLKTELLKAGSIAKVPVAWIDSEAESTTTDLQPYLPMLQCVCRLYRKYLPEKDSANAFAEFLEALDETRWAELLEVIPEAITSRNPSEFSEFDQVTVRDLLFAPVKARLQAEDLPELFQKNFERYFFQLCEGFTGFLPESEIQPVESLPDAENFGPELVTAGQEALPYTVLIKLNGGLGTSMGLEKAKSLLPVKDGLSFLDIIARQACQAQIPLVLMNSFATREDSLAALEKYPELRSRGIDLDFVQHKSPKLHRKHFTPASHEDPELEWCPPGHGDLYIAMVTSSILDQLLEKGFRYAFLSNSDNLGAVLDPGILGYMVTQECPFLMEVADRTEADRKGGHLARDAEGGLLLREKAQTPPEDEAHFQDITRHRYFNTNNLWLDLKVLKLLLEERDHFLGLPLIRNHKTVDPRSPESTPVYQLETAMGSAIGIFPGAQGVRVPRTRFAPVKTTSDLLLVRSDAYVLTEDFRVKRNPVLSGDLPRVELDPEFFKLIDDLEAHFPKGPPSLLQCRRLEVVGDVVFGEGVIVQGEARVEAEGETRKVPDHAVIGAV
jgi:UTP--glucose-1-phosphate uridylyltransferase